MTTRFDRLGLLATFVRVAERRSLTAAARDLGLSQPSVSRQIAALEDALGTSLLRRTTHDVTPTPDGTALLADARRLLAEWEVLQDRHRAEAALRGTIRVVAPVALGQTLLVRGLAPFLTAHPDLSIDWRLQDEPIRWAEAGCDAWIKVGSVPDDTLLTQVLGQVERLVVGHPCPSDASPLADRPWITLGPFEGDAIDLLDDAGRHHRFTVRPRLASGNIFAVLEAVRAGLGVAILPRWLVAADLVDGTLVDAAPDLRAARLPVTLATAPGARRPARVERFRDALVAWGKAHLEP
ncbi:LysR family transcriptional regulator [Jannaschia sp. LMIT008]|uniref:LysR family transcriptional regulator n=1 Tax=Jannaschia maritima TaxID=3032585 RepID=UPI002810CE20|nr:LysR family transcriptional regulator [Jannaschia sp. LMIT008]